MPDTPGQGTPPAPTIRDSLRVTAQLLRDPTPIDPKVRRALADLVDELSAKLDAPDTPPAEVARLAEVTAHLADALHHGHERGILEDARDGLKEMMLQAETRAPTAVHLVENVVNALASIGI